MSYFYRTVSDIVIRYFKIDTRTRRTAKDSSTDRENLFWKAHQSVPQAPVQYKQIQSTQVIFIYVVGIAFMNANPYKCEYDQITASRLFEK
jgi:hypothetical protein